MKFNKWTMGLAAVGVVSLASAARADEKMSQLNTAISNTTLSGYVDAAAVFNPGGIANQYAFAKVNGLYLNLIDLTLDKPLDESPWASGYHIDLNIGPDLTTGGAIRQAYIALRTPVASSGIDWKVGVMDDIIGYESNSDPLNPNYTRSYGYSIEPTTITGILGTYKANDMISFSAGIADTVFAYSRHHSTSSWLGINSGASNPSVLGSITLTAPDSFGWAKGATFNAGAVNSPSQNGAGATSWYAGLTLPTPVTALKVGAAFDLLDLHNASNSNSNGDNIWNVALYGNYQANEKLSFNLRGEYLNQENAGHSSIRVALPIAKEAEEVTATVSYQLWANVLSRAEIRWDHAEHGTWFATGGGGMATANAYTFALNLIYQF
jgi:hypothetical protein